MQRNVNPLLAYSRAYCMLSMCNAAFDTLYAGVGTAVTCAAQVIEPKVDELRGAETLVEISRSCTVSVLAQILRSWCPVACHTALLTH